MAVARLIFTLGRRVQLFLTAFDMPATGLPLKVALGYKKMFFGHFKQIIMMSHLGDTCMIIFLKHPKNIFLYPNATFNGTPVTGISKAVQNNWTHPPKVNIEQATAICLKKYIF